MPFVSWGVDIIIDIDVNLREFLEKCKVKHSKK